MIFADLTKEVSAQVVQQFIAEPRDIKLRIEVSFTFKLYVQISNISLGIDPTRVFGAGPEGSQHAALSCVSSSRFD